MTSSESFVINKQLTKLEGPGIYRTWYSAFGALFVSVCKIDMGHVTKVIMSSTKVCCQALSLV